MPNFETFTRRSTPVTATPLVTIQKRGTISLNRTAYELLGSPEAVELLYDRGERVIGIRAVDPDTRHAYPMRKQPSSYSYLFAGQAFAKYYDIPIGETRRYEAEMIGDVLAVDLKQTAMIPPPREREGATRAHVAAVA